MRLRGNRWPLRIAGSLFGLGCCAIGLFSIFGGGDDLPELNRERAFGFGVAAVVVGLVALIGSLTADAERLWYCMPRRWRPFRADVLDDWTTPEAAAPGREVPADDAGTDPWGRAGSAARAPGASPAAAGLGPGGRRSRPARLGRRAAKGGDS